MIQSVRNKSVFAVLVFMVVLSLQAVAAAPPPPNPVLVFLGSEEMEVAGKRTIRFHFDVFNKDEYPAEMFAAAPDLAPCGSNTKSARTWVDIYEMGGKRLNGFCAFGKPDELGKIWFALEAGEVPPSWVYIELTDRKTNTKYKSNLAETTL
jgi:hypothetical protein